MDGKWKHDEQQPFVTDTMKNCNNYLVVREAEIGLRLQGVCQGNMEVEDGDVSVEKVNYLKFCF